MVSEKEKKNYYKTGVMDDPGLVDRLMNAESGNDTGKIIFNKQIPKENSPLVNFLLMWIMPAVIFYLIWWQMSKLMQNRMGGGNVLSFGKSGAKIYAESELKTTFRMWPVKKKPKKG